MLHLPPDLLATAGGVAAVIGDLTYLRHTWHRRVRPQVISWTLWAILAFLAALPPLLTGHLAAAMVPLGVATCPVLVTATAAIRRVGNWRPDRNDLLCGALALLGAAAYAATQQGQVGVLAAVTADLISCIPTLRAAARAPQEESAGAYAGCVVAGGLGLVACPAWTLTYALFPAYLLLMSTAICALVLRPVRPAF